METKPGIIESLIDQVAAYGSTRYELSKLKSVEDTTLIASTILSRLGIMVQVMLCMLFVNIGLAILLGDLLGKIYYGFFIMAAFHLMLCIVLYFFLYRWIKKPVGAFIITQVLR